MNREIRFRGKRVDNGEWVHGYYINYLSIYGKQCHAIVTNKNFEKDILNNQVIPETIGQYTNLKDKNGKEIYEGDIIEYYEVPDEDELDKAKYIEKYDHYLVKKRVEVKYNEYGLICFYRHMIEPYWGINYEQNGEVIGTIYDTKEEKE